MEKNRVGVIVVNWNHCHDTIAAYNSLKSSTFENWHIYVVDNASTDSSSEFLDYELKFKSTLIMNSVNAGFSGGCNLGIRRAILDGSTHIFLLNNDALVLPQTIEYLINESNNLGNSAILGCLVKFYGTGKIQFFGSRTREDVGHPTWFDDNDSQKLSRKLIETDFVLGAALFAPTKIWEKNGCFDERFYLNYEETDWCYRARKIGFPSYIVPSSITIHKAGATIGPQDGPMQNYFLYRNELLFALKHATTKQKITIFARTFNTLLKSAIKDIFIYGHVRGNTTAHAIGIYDFLQKKFGECPQIIRKLSLDHRMF